MAYSRGRAVLQYWLEVRGISQTELSRRSGWSEKDPNQGWSPRMISHFCKNAKSMSPEAIYTFGEILGLENPLVDLYDQWHWDGAGEGPRR